MKKNLRFVLDFEVRIGEEIETKEPPTPRKEYLNRLLQEFLKDDEAVLNLYKLWLLGDLQGDVHYDAIEMGIGARDEKEIIKSVIKKLPLDVQHYFLDILARSHDDFFTELEELFAQFSLLEFKAASFKESQ